MFKSVKTTIILGIITIITIIAGFAWSIFAPKTTNNLTNSNSSASDQTQLSVVQLPFVDLTIFSRGNLTNDKYIIELDYLDLFTIPNSQIEKININKYPFENWISGSRATFLIENNELTFLTQASYTKVGSFTFQSQEYWYLIGGEGGEAYIEISKTDFVDKRTFGLTDIVSIIDLKSVANQQGVFDITAQARQFRGTKESKFRVDLTKTVQNPKDGVILIPA